MTSTRKQSSARSPRRRARPAASAKRRWLVLSLALGIAAAAFWVLLGQGGRRNVATGPPPLDDIDAASRVRLEHVLRDAELAEEPPR